MQITTPSAEIGDLLSEGRDYVTATSVDAFVQAASRWLERPDEAVAMGQRAQASLQAHRGWQGWWEGVAAALSDRGISLPLADAPVMPAPEEAPILATIASGLAHAHEAEGDTLAARRWFAFLCHLDPHDFDGHAGLARLAEHDEGRRVHWQAASATVEPTHPGHLPTAFGSQVTGTWGFAFQVQATMRWLDAAFATGRYDDVVAAARRAGPWDFNTHVTIVRHLMLAGAQGAARQCLDHAKTVWPAAPEWREIEQLLVGRPSR